MSKVCLIYLIYLISGESEGNGDMAGRLLRVPSITAAPGPGGNMSFAV